MSQPPQQPPSGQPPYGYPQHGQQPGPQGWGTPNPYTQPGQYPHAGYPYQQPGYPQYPQQPYGQPPHAWPPQPPQPPGGGGGLSGGRLAALIAGIVAAVLVVGGGVWLFATGGLSQGKNQAGSGSSPTAATPHDSQGALAWQVPVQNVTKAEGVRSTVGAWFNGPDLVKQTVTGVTAYNLATGHVHWTWTVPEGTTCEVTNTAVNNKVALTYGTWCENVAVFDISTGQKLWDKPLPFRTDKTNPKSDLWQLRLAISGDVLAVQWHGYSVAYRISTQQLLWQVSRSSDCHDVGFAGGVEMIDVIHCNSKKQDNVSKIDPVTRKAQWTWGAPQGTLVNNVISVNPVVIGLSAGSPEMTDVVAIDGQGKQLSRISLGSDQYEAECDLVDMTACANILVDRDTVYMATALHNGATGSGQINEIAAFDIATGRPKWLTKDQGRPIDLAAVDGAGVIGYETASDTEGGKVVAINSNNGAVTPYLNLLADTISVEHNAYALGPGMSGCEVLWHSQTLVVTAASVAPGQVRTYDVAIAAFH